MVHCCLSHLQASRARLFKEYKEVQREKAVDSDIQLVCDDTNIFKWTALIKVRTYHDWVNLISFFFCVVLQFDLFSIQGPSETPYEGGVFQLAFAIPEQYPLQPPQVRFLTKIFHPNVHFKVPIFFHFLQSKVFEFSTFTYIFIIGIWIFLLFGRHFFLR